MSRLKVVYFFQIPSSLECEIVDDLCERAQPGDVVVLTGVVRFAEVGGAAENCRIYLHALAVVNNKAKVIFRHSTQKAQFSISYGTRQLGSAASACHWWLEVAL